MSRLLLHLYVIGYVISIVLSFPEQRQIYLQQRNGNQRTSRGYQIQNGKLSTARGFGKRGGGGSDDFMTSAIQGTPSGGGIGIGTQSGISFENLFPSLDLKTRSYPSNWLIDEIQSNPELGRYVIEHLVDENGDGEVSQDELIKSRSLI